MVQWSMYIYVLKSYISRGIPGNSYENHHSLSTGLHPRTMEILWRSLAEPRMIPGQDLGCVRVCSVDGKVPIGWKSELCTQYDRHI